MLGHTWRLRASNTQNQSLTVTVKARMWKFGTDGALAWTAEQTLLSAVSIAATTGSTASATVNNATDGYLGAEVTLEVTASAATNSTGALALYVERSTDGGTTWPTQDQGMPIGGYTVTAADATSARRRNLLVG